jgi:hypothetical protein
MVVSLEESPVAYSTRNRLKRTRRENILASLARVHESYEEEDT